eukprot:TRINITY_DN1537_c0_g1_i6.p1 TRINITY_DN1537_c0_g1~~TRINITY_DN1537_c0_g1_i6.p1  ORF type:complete len:313 (-),score=32.97 TRINITY_DN1537_c0_g1_i6:405-1343(-)
MSQQKPKATVFDSTKMFLAGGTAGAIARTCTAPLDRIKLLFQVQQVGLSTGSAAIAGSGVGTAAAPPQQYSNLYQAALKIFREEGFLAYWKGNGTNIIRIFPYSAAQLAANDTYKRFLADSNGNLTVVNRLAAGACAGMTATALTHPLDTLRLRLALPNHGYNGMVGAFTTVVRTEGVLALYKGLSPTLIGIAPYAAMNFATYDLLKKYVYGSLEQPQNAINNLLIGGLSGTFAATVCYPLDTIRRRQQMKGQAYKGQIDAIVTIWAKEGMLGFYQGWLANTLKVVPQNSIRFVSYELIKKLIGVKKAKSDT